MNEKLEIKYDLDTIFEKTSLKELNKKNIPIDSKPAIYLFTFYGYKHNKKSYYIGETNNLKKRMTQYLRTPDSTQRTNVFVHDIIKKCDFEVHKLSISYLKVCEKTIISSKKEQDEKLESLFNRRIIENYFILKKSFIDEKIVLNKIGRAKKVKALNKNSGCD